MPTRLHLLRLSPKVLQCPHQVEAVGLNLLPAAGEVLSHLTPTVPLYPHRAAVALPRLLQAVEAALVCSTTTALG